MWTQQHPVAVLALTAILITPAIATASQSPQARCEQRLLASFGRIVRGDLRALARCALGNVDSNRGMKSCARIHLPGRGLARVDQKATRVLSRSCPELCPGDRRPCDAVRVAHCAAYDLFLLRNREQINPDFFEFCSPTTSTTSTTLNSTTSTTSSSSSTTSTTSTTSSTTTTLGLPRLTITEIMLNPQATSDAIGEYFEIRNDSGRGLDLRGLIVEDLGSDRFEIQSSLFVEPDGYIVLAKNAEAADGLADFVYGSAMNLANAEDEILLSFGDRLIDAAAYGEGFPLLPGRSLERLDSQEDGSLPAAWCAADSEMLSGDWGTPSEKPGNCLQLEKPRL